MLRAPPLTSSRERIQLGQAMSVGATREEARAVQAAVLVVVRAEAAALPAPPTTPVRYWAAVAESFAEFSFYCPKTCGYARLHNKTLRDDASMASMLLIVILLELHRGRAVRKPDRIEIPGRVSERGATTGDIIEAPIH